MKVFLATELKYSLDYDCERKIGEYIANNIAEHATIFNPCGLSKSTVIEMLIKSDYVLELDDSEDTKFLISVARFLNIDILGKAAIEG